MHNATTCVIILSLGLLTASLAHAESTSGCIMQDLKIPGAEITLTASVDGRADLYDFTWVVMDETGSDITGQLSTEADSFKFTFIVPEGHSYLFAIVVASARGVGNCLAKACMIIPIKSISCPEVSDICIDEGDQTSYKRTYSIGGSTNGWTLDWKITTPKGSVIDLGNGNPAPPEVDWMRLAEKYGTGTYNLALYGTIPGMEPVLLCGGKAAAINVAWKPSPTIGIS